MDDEAVTEDNSVAPEHEKFFKEIKQLRLLLVQNMFIVELKIFLVMNFTSTIKS